ncbi:TonB C-terminal domain-containing protein [Paraburkholderia panacisoli]|uniref:TonB C-terminal domain-containing protein n=1 Tax=Paraburkholderia panacisoli TaxID=2603818 RepID=A0A5B0G2Z8_9BURK|nr:TonB C-terminal domain-containing protein [Paraburkholderia panacisoli]
MPGAPKLVAPTDIEGNPSAVGAVTCAPNGSVLSASVQGSSGNPQSDNTASTALDQSVLLPLHVYGSTPASFLITFRPKRGRALMG